MPIFCIQDGAGPRNRTAVDVVSNELNDQCTLLNSGSTVINGGLSCHLFQHVSRVIRLPRRLCGVHAFRELGHGYKKLTCSNQQEGAARLWDCKQVPEVKERGAMVVEVDRIGVQHVLEVLFF